MSLKSSFFAPRARPRRTFYLSIRHRSHVALSVGLALTILLTSLGLTVSANTSSRQFQGGEHFIIYQGPNGESVCREATPSEARELEKANPKGLRPINHTEEKSMGLTVESENDGVQHLAIILRATANLDSPNGNAPLAKAAFIRAAAKWENIIQSPVTIYIDADFATDFFGNGQAFPTGVLGSTTSPASVTATYATVRQNLINGANAPGKLAVYNALPNDSVPTDLGNSNSVAVARSIARAIGLANPTASPDETPPRIAFNSTVQFDFDPSNGITANQLDFEAVATHEIGHALGFTSRSGTGSSVPAMWDLYRFRSGTTSGTFTSALRIMTIGGPTFNSQYYFAPGAGELGLSDGGPNNSKDNNADGNQSSHWRLASLGGGTFAGYIGIMDPQIPRGVKREITNNDIEALNIFGYNSNALAPATPPANDNFVSAQFLTGCSGTVGGTTIGATKEAGEPNHFPPSGGGVHSVWYQWQAPAAGSVTFTTAGSPTDTVLAIYIGSSVSSLSLIGTPSDDIGQTDKTSSVTFTATAGTTYRIAVDVFDNGAVGGSPGGDVGPITLNWSVSSCSGAVPIQLILDQTGPAADQASALDSILMVRDPFFVINSANVINPGSDRNTRIVIFVADLQVPAGAPASSVTVNLIDSNNQTFNVAAQDFRAVPNQALIQITFRLPDNLPAGTCKIKVMTQNQVSNTATIRIRN
jgi:hypothetical protein